MELLLLQLKYFCDAAETQNFAATAKKYDVPASNISQSVKRLENELQLPLFERQANRIILNEKGQAFYKKAKDALILLESAISETKDDGQSGKIRICVNCNKRVVLKTIEKFCKQYPNANISTRYNIFSDYEKFDFIVSSISPLSPDFSKETIIREKLCLAVNKDSPLANIDQIDVGMLANEDFITMGENSNLYNVTRRVCSNLGFEPHLSILVDDPMHVIKCVESGLGVAIAPTISWKGHISDKIVLKDIGNGFREICIFKNEKRYISKVADAFSNMLSEEFRAELEDNSY